MNPKLVAVSGKNPEGVMIYLADHDHVRGPGSTNADSMSSRQPPGH